jgi:hypothetical protein
LQEGLVLGQQPVDASGEHGLHGGRHVDIRQGPRQAVRPPRPEQCSCLNKLAHALFQEERIALRPRDQGRLERLESGVGPEHRTEELLGGLPRQGVEPDLCVGGAGAPGASILRTVIHKEQQPRTRQALDELVEQRLGLGVDPVEVFEDDARAATA